MANEKNLHLSSHSHHDKRRIANRLSRAIGHLSAVKSMVEDQRDCPEILIQLAAVRSALDRISELILSEHIDSCLAEAVRTGDEEAIAKMQQAVRLLLK